MQIVEVVLSLDIGGQERLVLRMAQAFHERGHDVHVVTLTPGGTLRGELGTLPVHDVIRRPGFDTGLHARLWRPFRSLRPDVVHTHNSVLPALRPASADCSRASGAASQRPRAHHPEEGLRGARSLALGHQCGDHGSKGDEAA